MESVRYTIIRTDFALQVQNRGVDCSFSCPFETTFPDLAQAYADLGNASAHNHQRRERFDVLPLDPLPVPEVQRIDLPIFSFEYLNTLYSDAVGDLVVIFRQTDRLNHRVTDDCRMRLSKWNQYRASV